ncbi:hypothetical protein F4820DRAFT_76744 [Hypoxylon rubiginosum]|uniref:Uncharacterized protein n=1 Tax=Hypoxylon rubiginosum TaxID=110542 RepID=A0ACB9ZBN3_9PEZI|nr:hypothetical protein F4820DRAFT_76744 [Hypoxylon rubiginosum]
MSSYHRRGVCKAIPSIPVTLLVASYDADSQLRSTVFSSDSKHHYSCADAPDEGVFIIFQNRALQIAAPPCDQRKCKDICYCDTSYHSTKIHSDSNKAKKRKIAWPTWKPCQNCLFNWLRLYPAAEVAHKRGMQFLQHPRTLTWSKSNGRHSFRYDGELEEDSVCSIQNGPCARSRNFISPCPPKLFKWMTDTWNEFITSGCYKPDRVISLPDFEDESCNDQSPNKGEDSDNGEAEESDSDGEWDDLDIPYKHLSQSRYAKSADEFDTIDDLIEEGEFPRLRKAYATKTTIPTRKERKPNQPQADDDDSDNSSSDGDAPAPVILPPKNMTIGRGLGRHADPRVPRAMRLGKGGAMCALAVASDLPRATPRPSLRQKRSHGDFAASEPAELLPAEDSPRMAKYQKREPSRPRTDDLHRRQGFAVQRPMSQIGHASPKLLVV